MNAVTQLTIYEEGIAAQTQAPEGCINDGIQSMDGTGAHLGLRNPWWNDLSHEITDSTIFRLLLIAMVVDWVLKKL